MVDPSRIFEQRMSEDALRSAFNKYDQVLPALVKQPGPRGDYWLRVWAYRDGDDVYYFKSGRRYKDTGALTIVDEHDNPVPA